MSDLLQSVDDILQSSRLNQRLLQRYKPLIGVINTQRLQSRFLQLPQVIAQRVALIALLQTRYSNDDENLAGSAELPLAKSQSASGYQTNSSPNLPPAPVASTQSNSSPASPTFRVSRKVIPATTSSAPTTDVQEQSKSGALQQPSVSTATSAVNDQSAIAKQLPRSIAPQLSVAKAAITTTPTQLEDLPIATPVSVSVPSLQQSKSKVEPTLKEAQPTVAKGLPLVNQPSQDKSSSKVEPALKQIQPTIAKVLPLVNEQYQKNSPSQSNVNHSQRIVFPENQKANAPEIPQQVALVTQPQLVFRQTATTPTADSTSAPLHHQHNSLNGFAVSLIPAKPAITERLNPMMAPHTPETISTHPGNIEDIAEQVSRILSRQFRIERERRGIGR